MRGKLERYGTDVFISHELLEMLLYHIVPYKDTNPIAKQLMFCFGSLDGVFLASKEELMRISGVGERVADFIISVGNAGMAAFLGDGEADTECVRFESFEAVKDFFVRYFKDKTEKEIVMLLLDSSMRSISLDTVYNLDYDSGAVRAKPFMDLAVKKRAAAVIIAHNHPDGPFFPTMGDRATNQLIQRSLMAVGVTLVEHYVVCGDSCFGLFNHISDKFSESLSVHEPD